MRKFHGQDCIDFGFESICAAPGLQPADFGIFS
jgi:hypothetical protein